MTGRLFIGLLVCLALWICASTLRWTWRKLFGVKFSSPEEKIPRAIRLGDQLLTSVIKFAAAVFGIILVLLAAILISRQPTKSEEASRLSGGTFSFATERALASRDTC